MNKYNEYGAFNCYADNRPVLTQIYDTNGDALAMGEIVDMLNLLRYVEEYIKRIEHHSRLQIAASCNSPSWIGYHNAMKDCVEELFTLRS